LFYASLGLMQVCLTTWIYCKDDDLLKDIGFSLADGSSV